MPVQWVESQEYSESDEAAFFRESISGQNERENTCLLQS